VKRAGARERLGAGRRLRRGEAGLAQVEIDERAQIALVIHDQDGSAV
jgi:hypothetical protein